MVRFCLPPGRRLGADDLLALSALLGRFGRLGVRRSLDPRWCWLVGPTGEA